MGNSTSLPNNTNNSGTTKFIPENFKKLQSAMLTPHQDQTVTEVVSNISTTQEKNDDNATKVLKKKYGF